MASLSAAELAACGSAHLPSATRRRDDPRVVIVGAGLAGLNCAYRLKQAGLSADVYEASTRVGGRTLSTRPGHFPDGQTGELGGEFIDSDHVTMHTLARELDIELEDRRERIAVLEARDLWWLSGTEVAEHVLLSQLAEVAESIKAQTEAAQRDAATFARLDQTSLADWLAGNVRAPALRTVLEIAYRGEYGMEAAAQSSLNLLLLIGAATSDRFQPFGDSDERFRARRGNQIFSTKLVDRLEGQLTYGHKLSAIRGSSSAGYVLSFRNGEQQREVQADVVVLAIPFTTLRQVDMSAVGLSLAKRTLITELGYGSHIKLLDAFKRRTWLEDHGASGSVGSDEPFQQFWDTSLAQPGRAGLLTTFLAGDQAVARKPDTWTKQVLLAGASAIFPGIEQDHIAGKTVQLHWPSQPHALASYACYRPGQWSLAGTEGSPEQDNTMLFCGEHTSVDYQGFMEGAAESGQLVASAILRNLGRVAHPAHAALVRTKQSVDQPAFGARAPGHTRPARALRIEQALTELARFG